MGGYAGEILRVDLTSEHIKSEELDMDIAEKFLGGRGLGVKILYDELEPKIDPLGNENEIIFATGPITGTNAPTAGRFCVSTKSPLTGTICNSMCGGHFGAELKYAGYDAVIIEGKSDRPVFLWIEDDKVEIQSAEGCWGLTTSETVESIRNLNKNILNSKKVSLDLEEALIMLSISAASNPTAQLAMEKLKELKGCEVHMTHMPTPGDDAGLRKLGVNLTTDPNFSSKALFVV